MTRPIRTPRQLARWLVHSLLFFSAVAKAMVVHDHDQPPVARKEYTTDEFPALAELPHQGYGVLIAPRWILTTAHAIDGDPVKTVKILGKDRAVLGTFAHPGFRMPSPDLLAENGAALIECLTFIDDVALLQLDAPIDDAAAPLAVYRGSDEQGQVGSSYGQAVPERDTPRPHHGQPHAGARQRAGGGIITSGMRWIGYQPVLSGRTRETLHRAIADPGSPIVMVHEGRPVLIGLPDWRTKTGDIVGFRGDSQGPQSLHVRVSSYATWIDDVMARAAPMEAAPVQMVTIRYAGGGLGAGVTEDYVLSRGTFGYRLSGKQSDQAQGEWAPVVTTATVEGEATLKDVNALLDTLKATPVSQEVGLSELANDSHAVWSMRHAYAELSSGPCPRAENLFTERSADPKKRAAALAEYYRDFVSADYTVFFNVTAKLSDGTSLDARSEARSDPTLPWRVNGIETWNSDLSRRVTRLLPRWSFMRAKTGGELQPSTFARLLMSPVSVTFEAEQLRCKNPS